MRIALIVDTYVPARTSAAVQMRDLARELQLQGHEPTVLVPSAELDASWLLELVDGVQVLRLKALRTKDVGRVRRGLAELLLPVAMLHGLARSPLRSTRWDGVVWYSPTIFLGGLVDVLKRRSGCRTYLILRDLFPDWAVDAGVMRRGIAYRFLKLVEAYQYSVADVIGVQTEANLIHLKGWAARPRGRLEVLSNWLADGPIRGGLDTVVSSGLLRGKLIFVYAGNMGVAQGMDCLIELATRLQSRSDVGFLFVGRGSEVPRLRILVAERALENVVFRDEVEPWDLPGLLAQCHVGLLALDPRHTTHNIPGKFLTYLRAGLPVLARINHGNDLEVLVNTHGVGRVCVGEPLESLHQLAEDLIADVDERKQMGLRGKALARNMFSVSAAAKKLIEGLSS